MNKAFLPVVSGLLVALSWSAGCDESPGGSSASDSATGGSGGGCEAGSKWCTCVESKYCDADLYCSPEVICVPSGGDTETGGTGETGGSDSDSSGTGGGCLSNTDCPDTQICDLGECLDIDGFYFEAEVTSFVPPDCLDGWGDAELFYKYFEAEIEQGSSPVSECPADWSGHYLFYDPLKSFNLEFWELDAFFDDFITSLCWPDGDSCGPVPTSVLHDGGFSGVTGDGLYYLEILFYPVGLEY